MILRRIKAKKERILIAVGFFSAALAGGMILLDVPLKWKLVFFSAIGVAIFAVLAKSLARILLAITAMTMPIYFGKALLSRPGHLGLSTGIDIRLTDVLILVLLLLFLADLATRRAEFRFFPILTIPALAWLMFSSLSLIAATDVSLATFQLVKLSKLVLLAWVVANTVRERSDVNFVIVGLLIGMVFQASIGIVQGVTGQPVGLEFLSEATDIHKQKLDIGLASRVQGTMGHANNYATYVVTILPVALALLVSRTKRSARTAGALASILGLTALVFALSRSAWINTFLVSLLVLAFAVRSGRIGFATGAKYAGGFLLAIAALVFFGTDTILSRLTSSDFGSAIGRVPLAMIALTIFRDHPWVGIGLNNYSLISPQYGGVIVGQEYVVHNAYLLIASETGILGLAAFLSLLAALVIRAWKVAIAATDASLWIAGIGVFAALMALGLHSLWDYGLLEGLIAHFWFLAGLIAGVSRIIESREQRFGRVAYHTAVSR